MVTFRIESLLQLPVCGDHSTVSHSCSEVYLSECTDVISTICKEKDKEQKVQLLENWRRGHIFSDISRVKKVAFQSFYSNSGTIYTRLMNNREEVITRDQHRTIHSKLTFLYFLT